MSDDFITNVTAILARLRTLAETDAELRGQLRALVRGLLAFAQEPSSGAPAVNEQAGTAAPPSTPIAPPTAPAHPVAPPAQPLRRAPTAVPLPPLEFASAAPREASFGPGRESSFRPYETAGREMPFRSYETISDDELPWIASRCALKAEAARWAATRLQRLREGADAQTEIEPRDRDIISRAKELPKCFLWMSHPSFLLPSDLTLLEDVAGCFEAAASILRLLQNLLHDLNGNAGSSGTLEQALDLAAEAQSALRVAVDALNVDSDTDQVRLYRWLRAAALERQVWIQHYMRMDDAADPKKSADLLERIAQFETRVTHVRQDEKKQRNLLNKVRYHLKRLTSDEDEDRLHDWQQIIEAVDGLVRDGLPPSNRELRDLLLPVLDDLPDIELPVHFELVLREVDRFLASRPETAGQSGLETARSEATPIPEVRQVADLLHGRTLLLIGGDERSHARAALADAFHCPVIWHATREQQTRLDFEGDVARPDVAAVLLAIRFSRHAFGDVKIFCEKYNKPLVRLPGGYNPNQVAVQILTQVSERLKNGKHE